MKRCLEPGDFNSREVPPMRSKNTDGYKPAVDAMVDATTVASATHYFVGGFVHPEGSKDTNPKEAFGDAKLPLHLWPTTATAVGCLAFLEGALKYGRSNFREKGVRASTYQSAAKRHLEAWFEGEDIDPESGIPHLGKALACIAIIVDAEAAGKLRDDRMYKGGYNQLVAKITRIVGDLKELHKDKNPKHYTKEDENV